MEAPIYKERLISGDGRLIVQSDFLLTEDALTQGGFDPGDVSSV